MPHQNNPRYPKCKQDGKDKRGWEVLLEKIHMQVTKAAIKKVKTITEKT